MDEDIEFEMELRKEIYSGKTLRIFLSYSTEDKNLAGNIKKNLERYGLEVFLAHEDIEPSSEWQDEIVRNLKSCDIFMPIISKNFRNSDWTDQETGMAFIEGKVIIPLRTELVPYGFIGKYQALKLDLESIKDSCQRIIQTISKNDPLKEKLTDCIISSFVRSYSFSDANEKALMLKELKQFTEDQANEIIRGFIVNDQISGAYDAKPVVEEIFSNYTKFVKPLLKKKFKEIIKNKEDGG